MQYSFLIRKRSRDNYQLILSYKGKDGKWHQKAKGGFTKARLAAADTEKAALVATVKDKLAVDEKHKDITLRDFLDIYASDRKIRPTTKANYLTSLSFLGDLVDKPMKDVTLAEVKGLLAICTYTLTTKNTRITTIKTLFRSAYEDYAFLAENPLRRLKRYANPKEVVAYRILTDEEVDILLADTAPEEFRAIAAVGALAGLRVSETLGLTMADINLKDSTLTVNKQWHYTKDGYCFAPPKTRNSNRTVPIPPRLRSILLSYLASRKVVAMNGRIFTARNHQLFNIWMKSLVGKSSHALRHTYITNLIANGVDVKTAAALAGDTPTTILERYVHYTDKMREKAKEDVIRIFG